MAIIAFLSRSPGLLNRGLKGPASLVFFIASYFQLQLLNRGPEGPLCWVLAFSTASSIQLVWSPTSDLKLCTVLYNSSTSTFFVWASQIALIQPVHGQDYILIFLDRMHLLFTQVPFLFWQPSQVGGQYTTIAHFFLSFLSAKIDTFSAWRSALSRKMSDWTNIRE